MGIKSSVSKALKSIRQKEFIPIQNDVTVDNLFQNKVAIIIGGSGGIGLAIAKSLYHSGCRIILCGTNEIKLNRCLEEFNDLNNIRGMIFNISDLDKIKENVKKAFSIFGRIDILVNSAGVHTENVDFFTMSPSEYDRVININLKGPYFVCQEFARNMINNHTQEKKHILFVSSSRGSEPAWTPYGVSKWALNGFTKGLAQMLLPHGIVVNAIAPGSTATELIGFQDGNSINSTENGNNRLIMPEEVAYIAKMLVSSFGDMIVGDVIHISGGRGVFDIR